MTDQQRANELNRLLHKLTGTIKPDMFEGEDAIYFCKGIKIVRGRNGVILMDTTTYVPVNAPFIYECLIKELSK